MGDIKLIGDYVEALLAGRRPIEYLPVAGRFDRVADNVFQVPMNGRLYQVVVSQA